MPPKSSGIEWKFKVAKKYSIPKKMYFVYIPSLVLTLCLLTAGHFIRDIDRGSPAEQAGAKDMDRLVAVDGKEVDGLSHEQVVDRIKKCGNHCCLLVVDKETDQMYKQVSQVTGEPPASD